MNGDVRYPWTPAGYVLTGDEVREERRANLFAGFFVGAMVATFFITKEIERRIQNEKASSGNGGS